MTHTDITTALVPNISPILGAQLRLFESAEGINGDCEPQGGTVTFENLIPHRTTTAGVSETPPPN